MNVLVEIKNEFTCY